MSERIDGSKSLQEAPILTHADEAAGRGSEEVDEMDEIEERLAVAPPHVAIIGRSGSGKTAIAQALFGTDTEPTLVDIADRYQGAAAPLILDDLPGWSHGNDSSVESLFSYLKTARDSGSSPDLIWYTLDASSARVTEYELDLMRRFGRERPLAIVLTRCDLVAPDALATMRSTLAAGEIAGSRGIVSVAADPLPVLGVAPYGLAALIALAENVVAMPSGEPVSISTSPSPDESTSATPDAILEEPENEEAAEMISPSPAFEEWSDPIQPPAPPTPPSAAGPRFAAERKPDMRKEPEEVSAETALAARAGTAAGQMLAPEEAGPSTTSLIALAAVIALAIALLLLQIRRRDEEE